jgi:hypothetical protein
MLTFLQFPSVSVIVPSLSFSFWRPFTLSSFVLHCSISFGFSSVSHQLFFTFQAQRCEADHREHFWPPMRSLGSSGKSLSVPWVRSCAGRVWSAGVRCPRLGRAAGGAVGGGRPAPRAVRGAPGPPVRAAAPSPAGPGTARGPAGRNPRAPRAARPEGQAARVPPQAATTTRLPEHAPCSSAGSFG